MDDLEATLVATLVATLMCITIYCIEKAFQPQYIVIRRLWQGRRDSNTQPTVLETATLPLSHSPKQRSHYIIKKIVCQLFFGKITAEFQNFQKL